MNAGCWWLTSEILATLEAEIRRITVWSQTGQIVHETLSWKKSITKKGWWRCRPWVQAPVPQKKKKKKKMFGLSWKQEAMEALDLESEMAATV
jgi:hypothetical protein